ncbi:hypothetical protein PCANC_00540 [Puccinia coronata f. sp. avenae]|uniref:F-box domain-containing protein n=1 Tax=Puccinia coronata f. sp. avenae TaxID=200324 RepID=A0A2N5W859_9BASI|nr:hypothetical protein PCANC_00540 [Puccinia coronata f. sp. avenae]
MAKLTDLPAELLIRIIHHVLYPKGYGFPYHEHHFLDHTQISRSSPPKPRPHRERIVIRRPVIGQQSPRPYYGQVSWPEGLPENPLLPLSLVNPTFRQCAQELLFSNVALPSKWTAMLFLRSLTSVPPHDDPSLHARQNDDTHLQAMQAPRPSGLSRHVRSLQFSWGLECSMGQGGGSMFCDIIHSCPLLENIAISNTFLLACKEPILDALASKTLIKELVVHQNTSGEGSTFQWQAHEVLSRLFLHWNSLETVEFFKLSGWPIDSLEPAPTSIPTLNCAIRTMILNNHDLDEHALSTLLKSCGESMRKLKITGPNYRLDRAALCRVLQECTSPNLETLILVKSYHWEDPLSSNLDSDDPLTSPGLLDIVFNSPTALKNLKTLSFRGIMATGRLFERLPKSIIKLSWERCDLPAYSLLNALTSRSRDGQNFLPNLECCSVHTRDRWSIKDRTALEKAFKRRGACFHIINDYSYTLPRMMGEMEGDNFSIESADPL